VYRRTDNTKTNIPATLGEIVGTQLATSELLYTHVTKYRLAMKTINILASNTNQAINGESNLSSIFYGCVKINWYKDLQ